MTLMGPVSCLIAHRLALGGVVWDVRYLSNIRYQGSRGRLVWRSKGCRKRDGEENKIFGLQGSIARRVKGKKGKVPQCCVRSVYLQRIPQGIDAFLLVRHTVDHLAVLLLILAALVGCKI